MGNDQSIERPGRQEGANLHEFVRSLADCGLMSVAEVQVFLETLPRGARPTTADQLARELCSHGKLTKFQAQSLCQGKADGLVLGNYVVLDRLGKGGMGEVFKARHARMDRVVALKVLPSAATKSAEAIKRFRREAKTVAKLSHPNIVTAYDADEANGMHFLVMEYVNGSDLASVVKKHGVLAVSAAVDYLLQAARGLEYAHRQGIIHRDIKPSNLILDAQGNVKILDMGLARIEETMGAFDPTAEEGLTQTGQVLGTLDYMPPEQAVDTKLADARADIYSLGCTLYHLLNGRPPYGGDTVAKKILAHRDAPIPWLRQSRPDVSGPLNAIFQTMVAKKVEDRQQSMGEVIAQLQRCVGGKSDAPPNSWLIRATAETVKLPAKTTGARPARDLSTAAPPREARWEALQRLKVAKRQQETRQKLRQAVKDADRDYLRRHGFGLLNRLRKIWEVAVNLGVKLIVLAAIAWAGSFVFKVWQNVRLVNRRQEQIVRAVNPRLGQRSLEAISSVEFTNTSLLRPVPEPLFFETPLFQKESAGHRRAGTLAGRFDSGKGRVEVDIEIFDGAGEFGVVLPVTAP